VCPRTGRCTSTSMCPHTGLSASNHFVLLEDLTDLLGLTVREHKADVELDRVAKLEERGL
jgi:hypothetical protein